MQIDEDVIQVTEDKIPEIQKRIIDTPDKTAALEQPHDKLMIDFDHTIADNTPDHEISNPLPGVKEAFDKLKADGWHIVIYSGTRKHA